MNKQTLETACKNYNPDIDHNGSYGHYLADLVLKQRKENEELNKRAEFEIDSYFIKQSNELNLNPDNVFNNIYEKQNLLKKIKGYKSLKGDKNSFGNGSDAKIGLAFKNIYNSALRKIKEYVGGEK